MKQLLLSSFTGVTDWTVNMKEDELATNVNAAVAKCVDGNMATLKGDVLTITRLGKVCAAKGIGVGTAAALAEWAAQAQPGPWTKLEVLTIAALTKAGDDVHISLSTNEFKYVNYRKELVRGAQDSDSIGRPVFAGLAQSRWAPEYNAAKAYKKALMLRDWIEEVETREIEERYQVWAGTIRRIGEEFSWIIEALSAIAIACDWTAEQASELESLSNRLLFGVRADAVPLARLRIRGLGRGLLRRLARAGFGDVESIREAGPELVRKALNHSGVFERLWAKVTHVKKAKPSPYPQKAQPEVLMAAEPTRPTKPAKSTKQPKQTQTASEEEPVLVVDLKAHSVRYRGHALPDRPPNHLQRQLFLALAVLASKPTQAIGMNELADEMLRIGELKKRPVAPDARDLRYRVLRALKKALSDTQISAKELNGLIDCVQGQLRLGTSSAVILPRKAA
jgi:hypothetical protein